MPKTLRSKPDAQSRTQAAMRSPQRYRFAPEQFHLLGKLGVFDDNARYELIEGDIYHAKHGISEYWIVNLPERTLEVYREPTGEDYSAQLRYTLEESISPLFDPEWQIPVRALFEG